MQTRFIIGTACFLALNVCHSTPQIPAINSTVLQIAGNAGKSLPGVSSNQNLTTKEIAFDASPTAFKYRVLDLFPNPFYCDPDLYPVARAVNAAELARQHLQELQANREVFLGILKHNGLTELSVFTDEQAMLIYNDYKKLRAIYLEPAGNTYRFKLRISESKHQGFLVKGTFDSSGAIIEQERKPGSAECPICLAPQTQIDTPKGAVAVAELHVGDAVWTADASGARLAGTIVETARVPVPADHRMVHLVLNDGRELWSSPGHPTVDKRTIGDLRNGDMLSGGRITRTEIGEYHQPATYDLLPSGSTGNYWANGILIGSTLANKRQ